MNKLMCISMLIGLTACAQLPPLNEGEKSVRILRKSDPPDTCKELGNVTGVFVIVLNDDERIDNLKRSTAKIGGDTVQITIDTHDGYPLQGIAFRCNKNVGAK